MGAFIQQTRSATATAASIAVTLTPRRAGNLLFVCWGSISSTPSSATDSAGNTLNALATQATNSFLYSWYTENCLASATTITVNVGSTDSMILIVREYESTLRTGALDKQTAANGTTANTASSGATSALALPNQIVIGCASIPTTGVSLTAGSGFGRSLIVTGTLTLGIEDLSTATVDPQTATFSISGGGAAWAAAVATFYATNKQFRQNSIRPYPFSPGIAR